MRTGARLGAYAAGLALVLAGGAGLGAVAGPIDVGADPADGAGADHGGEAGDGHGDEANAGAAPAPVEMPAGLAVAQGGYRLVPEAATLAPGAPTEWRFRVVDAEGAPVTDYEEENERDLHLIVVDRGLADYAHLHPTLARSGTWSADLPALRPGSYRAFADFRPTGGDELTLGVDLTVTGRVRGADAPPPSEHDQVDGYEVTVEGEPRPGDTELTFTVRRGGESVRTDPYLGAAGHLVAIRDGDLAYLHVHPVEGDGDEIRFAAEFPSAGRYRLFLDFSHGGEVRTAAFAVTVPDEPAAGTSDDDH